MVANEQGQICVICNQEIAIGEEISWNRRGNSGRYHVACKVNQTPTQLNGLAAMQAPNASNGLAAILANSIEPFLNIQRDEITEELEAFVSEKISEALANIPKEIRTVYVKDSGPIATIDGPKHEKFDLVFRLVSMRKNLYLWGEAGSGKSTVARTIAGLLNLPFFYTGLQAQMTASVLMGYMDANGNYVPSELYKAYKNGGVFLLDELELASGNLLGSLNGALANGKAAFPCGMVDRHPDFVCIATGNTPALGATIQFSDRRALDGSVRDRFHFVQWDTDKKMEHKLARARFERSESWVTWVQNVREMAKAAHPKLTCTQRASIEGADLLAAGLSPQEIADMLVFRGYDAVSVRAILSTHPLPTY